MAKRRPRARSGDALWYKDAIFYEIRVRSFYDGDGDGLGDFRGLAERLDYLKDLGVTTLWLLPFYPSPLRDDGYDISDYSTVDPDCGTIDDFKHFLDEAHARDLRVLTELVINHTSDQHPWFQRARRSEPGSRWRNFYVWSDTPERYPEARIIFKDYETSNWSWDPVAKAYYWHRFFSHQPDLNFDNPEVRDALRKVMDFWFNLGVDGMRLDAIPYLFERDGTNCENLPETHELLKWLRQQVDRRHKNRMFLAEANQWSEDAVAYFGDGDECHMSFHFPVMPRLFMALHMEDRYPIVDILQQTPAIPESCQWALFLRNHDELTLEMVTDEERDYMYRVYAHESRARINLGIRRRLAPLLKNDRRRIELMNALLFSLPGTPIIYYGDEIGMGDNFYLGDRNGVRTPMQWSGDRNAGFSRANPQRLYLPVIIDPEYHYESVNVETQEGNPSSLLWWMKRLIALRKRYRAFSRGRIEFLSPQNAKVLAFIREHANEHILVVANLSRFVQYVELDLQRYRGWNPIEVFGQSHFPPIGDLPYLLTMGPHSFYWFVLQPESEDVTELPGQEHHFPALRVSESWQHVLEAPNAEKLQEILRTYLPSQRWFGGKARRVRNVRILDRLSGPAGAVILLLQVEYADGSPETYVLPLAFASGRRATELRDHHAHHVIANLEVRTGNGGSQGVLHDAVEDSAFTAGVLDLVRFRKRLGGAHGSLTATTTRAFRKARREQEPAAPFLPRAEQSNTSVIYGDQYILKLFRRPAEGVNPDLEIGRHLTERTRFRNISPVLGALEYTVPRREPTTLAILQGFVPNEGDAWRYTLDEVSRYFERTLEHQGAPELASTDIGSLLELCTQQPPDEAQHFIGANYLESARLLGRRTAELHIALASQKEIPEMAPESLGTLYQRSLYQGMRNLSSRVFATLRQRLGHLPESARRLAEEVLERHEDINRVFYAIVGRRMSSSRIRCHGDYHLGQVLYTGRDFVIIDFEGEPARSLTERRLKRSPMVDVAGMLRSFSYAAEHALVTAGAESQVRPEDVPRLQPWARFWQCWASSAFLRAYFRYGGKGGFLPSTTAERELLLRVFVLEKAIYELGYELNNRPDWVRIPLHGILQQIGARSAGL